MGYSPSAPALAEPRHCWPFPRKLCVSMNKWATGRSIPLTFPVRGCPLTALSLASIVEVSQMCCECADPTSTPSVSLTAPPLPLPCTSYELAWNAHLRSLADRTAIMATGLLPLVIVTATRRTLPSVSGIDFGNAMLYHRWLARFCGVHALIHSVAWTVDQSIEGLLAEAYADPYWNWGCASTAMFIALIFLSIRQLRVKAYEVSEGSTRDISMRAQDPFVSPARSSSLCTLSWPSLLWSPSTSTSTCSTMPQ